METDRLLRACGLDSCGLGTLLDQLVAAGTITAWACDPATDELHWTVRHRAGEPLPTANAPIEPRN
jgi:hypothetical protein